MSGLQTRLETSGTGIRQNRLVLADVTEYIYLPQSAFTPCFVFLGGDKKKGGESGGEGCVGVRGVRGYQWSKRSFGGREGEGGGGRRWEITGNHGGGLIQKYGQN